jgi:c-di-GMP-binding flagellar brake protein YcgR
VVLLVILGVLIIGIVLFMVMSQKPQKDAKKKKASWVQFFAKGKDAGFSFKEIELLRQLAIKNNLDHPSSLFWSQTQLDACISSFVKNARISGEDQQQETQDIISKLYDYRKKIELEKPQYKKGLTSSHNIEEGQPLKITVKKMGTFPSKVIKNTTQYLTVEKPSGNDVPASIKWSGAEISIYFWRRDDAGYVFASSVWDEVSTKDGKALQISHNDSLRRTQKRTSIRVKIEKPAFLYLLNGGETNKAAENNSEIKCRLSDLSEDGCSVIVEGSSKPGFRVRVQFALGENPISIDGTVRSVDYKEKEDKSILHIESDPMSLAIKNRIRGEVFGVEENSDYLSQVPEQEDDHPHLDASEVEQDAETETKNESQNDKASKIMSGIFTDLDDENQHNKKNDVFSELNTENRNENTSKINSDAL